MRWCNILQIRLSFKIFFDLVFKRVKEKIGKLCMHTLFLICKRILLAPMIHILKDFLFWLLKRYTNTNKSKREEERGYTK